MWVSPFRYPRIKGYLLLPVAFRSLSRLSSALSAKASTLRSFYLNLSVRGGGSAPLSYVRSVGRLGLGSFNVFTKFILIHCLTLITTTCHFGKNVYVLLKTTQLFFTSFLDVSIF